MASLLAKFKSCKNLSNDLWNEAYLFFLWEEIEKMKTEESENDALSVFKI